MTPAVRFLKAHGVAFEPLLYDYVEKGGTKRSSAELGVDEHHVVKTLVLQDDGKRVFLVLMHGDRKVSTKKLARDLGVRSVGPAPERVGEKATGYLFGGTSPFGTSDPALPVYVERSILTLDWILINGGKRGFLVRLAPAELQRVLPALTAVDVAMVEV
jgi:Cys-tRNA(Pro) deacylase